MEYYSIQSHVDCRTLYEGKFASFTACLEQAVADKIILNNANLKNRNLANACLDDGLFAGADFSACNLSGANLSEACMKKARFINADLYNTCLALGNLKECDFTGASFGATDIAGTNIEACRFSTLSCFSLNFPRTQEMKDSRFVAPDGTECALSSPPPRHSRLIRKYPDPDRQPLDRGKRSFSL
mgnify:CR=1 FL=1